VAIICHDKLINEYSTEDVSDMKTLKGTMIDTSRIIRAREEKHLESLMQKRNTANAALASSKLTVFSQTAKQDIDSQKKSLSEIEDDTTATEKSIP